MTPPISEAENALAVQAADEQRSRDFWVARCRYCAERIRLVADEVGVSRAEAIQLWAAMLNDNAANNISEAMHHYGDVVKSVNNANYPLATKLLKYLEHEARADKPWDPGNVDLGE